MVFPDHLMANILSRLPVKSLIRFISARKAWRALIGDPHFISQHLSHAIAKSDEQSSCLLVKYRCKITRKHIISLLFLDSIDYRLSILEIPCVVDSEHFKFVGSCNGLLCLANEHFSKAGSSIILWNPSTREFRVLPEPDGVIGTTNLRVCSVIYGFGYYPLICDYKVVRIRSLSCSGRRCNRAEVYSLKMDCWREIETFYFDIYEPSCTALNGVLYWYAFGRGDRALVLSFDICDEVFGQLQLPDLSILESTMCTKLTAFKESLCLIAYTFRGRQREFYLWKMIEHDAEVFWKMELRIGPLLGVDRPLGCGLYGDIYIENIRGQLVMYNPSTEESKIIPTCGIGSSLEVHFHVESLVSTAGQNEARQDGNGRMV